ncbi:CoA pyrophosphatase [Hoyosella sp. YIM 151337]|uniref:NUDIX hydrolase n=1 Tax=Hoyosella sp. YIM 151337 TaxID=2992742 RepID=UPI002235F256|nr:CoA pyrophosphatase [Hoyosella sp. YIM 151337]MCW4352713.1 CoA pyrophosphatase [Hoyosella sp. YIM 151337]
MSGEAHPRLMLRAPADIEPRPAAVLILFSGPRAAEKASPGGLPEHADVLLTQRAATMRQHRGQVAFPGGAADMDDDDAIATALREAEEETGLRPAGVRPLVLLPEIFVPVSGFEVTPVVAYWENPSPVWVVDPSEASRVARVPVHDLIEPANRFVLRHSEFGYESPAFLTDGMLIWGFTAGLLAGMLSVSGWEKPWDQSDVRDMESILAEYGMEVRRR